MRSSIAITSLTPNWAVEHRSSLVQALRETMRLRPEEDLHLVQITPLGNSRNPKRARERRRMMELMDGIGAEDQVYIFMSQH